MNSRQRVMTALDLKEPDRVPFVDSIDNVVKQKIMGADEIDEAELAYKIGMDAICFSHATTWLIKKVLWSRLRFLGKFFCPR